MPDRLMLLDTASLYFRAFYGVPDTIRRADGTPVNAVRGLLDMIARLTTDYGRRISSRAGTTIGARSGGSTSSRATSRIGSPRWWQAPPMWRWCRTRSRRRFR